MLNQQDFDLWAESYDADTAASDSGNTYPFAGYDAVLERIFRTVTRKKHPSVLDIGFGTGVLTAKLYESGCKIFGQDFSEKMLEAAAAKMPGAALYRGDFGEGLAAPLLRERYDFIIATYSLHHLTDDGKSVLLRTLMKLLKEDGQLLIGDVAFETRAELERCQAAAGDEWDDEEYYFVAEELKNSFPGADFRPVSFCAGVLTIPFARESARLFLRFRTQKARREYGGSDFAELQRCGLPFSASIGERTAVDAVSHWKTDSLYLYGDDFGLFYARYADLFGGGIYACGRSGPPDLYGINYYPPEQTAELLRALEQRGLPDDRALCRFLKRAENGFYLLGE